MVLWLAMVTAAQACVCNGFVSAFRSTVPEDAVLPTNSHLWVLANPISGIDPDAFAVVAGADAVPVDATLHPDGEQGGWFEIVPQAPFAPGVTVTLWYENLELGSWPVGASDDVEPPQWQGDVVWEVGEIYTGKNDVIPAWGCGNDVYLAAEAVDWTDAHPVFLFVAPQDEGYPIIQKAESELRAYYSDVCGGNDPTVLDSPRRSYRAQLVDIAGNRTDAFETDTRSGASGACGCVSGAGPTPGAVLALSLLIGLRRRRFGLSSR